MPTLHPISLIVLPGCAASTGWIDSLRQLVAGGTLAQGCADCEFQLVFCATQDEVIAIFERAEASPDSRRYILLSDVITEEIGKGSSRRVSFKPLEWVKEHIALSSLGVTAAVQVAPQKIVDIDRVVSPLAAAEEWLAAIKQLTAKLLYLSRPGQQPTGAEVCCRAISQHCLRELDAYFRLRHSVYSIMGYLEPEVEFCTSRLEIDSSDPDALHFGAFVTDSSGECLVGTSRVVTNRRGAESLSKALEEMAVSDPVIAKRLRKVLPLQLPVFQSQRGMNPILTQILRENLVCGELSRVIVRPENRGCKISEQLVDHAIVRAREQGVQRLFLECLPCHVPFYERMGFRTVLGMKGQVFGVQRTMGVMELDFTARPGRPR